MKVYVIMSGCIDDRFCYGVYATEQKANEAYNAMSKCEKLDTFIEEHEVQ